MQQKLHAHNTDEDSESLRSAVGLNYQYPDQEANQPFLTRSGVDDCKAVVCPFTSSYSRKRIA